MATVYLGSVSPIPLKVTRAIYGGFYEFKPVARGEAPFVLQVTDKIQYERELVTHNPLPRTVLGEDIAADILRELNGGLGMGDNADMGVFLIGSTPQYTEEQAEDARLRLRNHLNWLVQDTDAWSAERRAKFISTIGIPPIRKIAVQYLGLERDWATMTPNMMTNCPHCAKAVKTTAIICEHCEGIIDYERWAANEAKKQAALAKYAPQPEAPKVSPNVPLKQQAATR